MSPHFISQILQVIVALGLLNVWVLRTGRPTAYRGGGARNIREEFAMYGLPPVVMYVVGFLKVACALALLIGLFYPILVKPAAALLVLLMMGALGMHLKIQDPPRRSLPAVILMLLSALILFL